DTRRTSWSNVVSADRGAAWMDRPGGLLSDGIRRGDGVSRRSSRRNEDSLESNRPDSKLSSYRSRRTRWIVDRGSQTIGECPALEHPDQARLSPPLTAIRCEAGGSGGGPESENTIARSSTDRAVSRSFLLRA